MLLFRTEARVSCCRSELCLAGLKHLDCLSVAHMGAAFLPFSFGSARSRDHHETRGLLLAGSLGN